MDSYGSHCTKPACQSGQFRKPQTKFLVTLFTTMLLVCGKVNFTNLSRYSALSEGTYRRQYQQDFEFAALNRALVAHSVLPTNEWNLHQLKVLWRGISRVVTRFHSFENGCMTSTLNYLPASNNLSPIIQKRLVIPLNYLGIYRQVHPTSKLPLGLFGSAFIHSAASFCASSCHCELT